DLEFEAYLLVRDVIIVLNEGLEEPPALVLGVIHLVDPAQPEQLGQLESVAPIRLKGVVGNPSIGLGMTDDDPPYTRFEHAADPARQLRGFEVDVDFPG